MSFILLFWLIVAAKGAYAYIDPGTGSYMLQLAVAGILGTGYVIKLYWGRIKSFFTDLFMGRKPES